jgi:hypothetical protein
VEALYRGELESARENHLKSPSSVAEIAVGGALNASPESIRKICAEVRRKRRDGTALPDSPAITVTEFDYWKKTGRFYESQRNTDNLRLNRSGGSHVRSA